MPFLIRVYPLRESRPFARLWLAGLIVSITGQMVNMAIAWTVYDETSSSLAVGGLGLAIGIPTVVFGLIGGALTDIGKPRSMGLIGIIGQFLATFLLLLTLLTADFSLALLYALVAAQAAFAAITAPTRRPYIRYLLAPASIPAAMGLYMLTVQAGNIVGPLFGGLLLSQSTLAVIIAIHCLAFVPYVISVVTLPDIAPAAKERMGVKSIWRGLLVSWRIRDIRHVMLTDIFATFFALPLALLPALNEEVLNGNATTYGWLLTAMSTGGVIGTFLSGWLEHISRPVRMVMFLMFSWCVAVAWLGFNETIVLALMALFTMGLLDVWSVILQQTVVQNQAPQNSLGRVGSLQGIVNMGGPQLGNFRAGAMGSIFGAQAAIVIGALLSAGLIAGIYMSSHRADHKD